MSTITEGVIDQCEFLQAIKTVWDRLKIREQSDLARDVDIITQQPPRRDVYSVSSTKSLSSVKLIERVESRWASVPDHLRSNLADRCKDIVFDRELRAIRSSKRRRR